MKKFDEMSVEKIMSSLDDLQKVNAPLGFEHHLNERILQKEIQWMKTLKWSIAAMLILGLLNMYTLVNVQSGQTSSYEETYQDWVMTYTQEINYEE
jgi:hypothetical protein